MKNIANLICDKSVMSPGTACEYPQYVSPSKIMSCTALTSVSQMLLHKSLNVEWVILMKPSVDE